MGVGELFFNYLICSIVGQLQEHSHRINVITSPLCNKSVQAKFFRCSIHYLCLTVVVKRMELQQFLNHYAQSLNFSTYPQQYAQAEKAQCITIQLPQAQHSPHAGSHAVSKIQHQFMSHRGTGSIAKYSQLVTDFG